MIGENKRIAIQISGHLRTFEDTHLAFIENVIRPNEETGYMVDVFIHTWDEIEYSARQWHNENTPEKRGLKLTEVQIERIKDIYNPRKLDITPQLNTSDSSVFSEFTGGETQYATMTNVWFTKYRVNELRMEYESEADLKYDYVMHTRADILFESKFVVDEILAVYDGVLKNLESPKGKLFFSGCHREAAVKEPKLLAASDILYFGTPEVMNGVSSIYKDLDKDELATNFISWENYLIYTAQKLSFEPIQLAFGLNRDWRILRFADAFPSQGKTSPSRKKKWFSLRIRKYFICLRLGRNCFKMEMFK